MQFSEIYFLPSLLESQPPPFAGGCGHEQEAIGSTCCTKGEIQQFLCCPHQHFEGRPQNWGFSGCHGKEGCWVGS